MLKYCNYLSYLLNELFVIIIYMKIMTVGRKLDILQDTVISFT